MYRCVLFSVFVTTLTVSGLPKSKFQSGSRSKPPGAEPCVGNPHANTACDMGYWTGICVDAYDKIGVSGHQICRAHCGEPALDPLANVVLAAAFDSSTAYGSSTLALQCSPGYAPAPGSNMTITCVDGQWSSFAGECLKDCGVPTFSGQLSNVVVLQLGGQLHGDVAVLGCSAPYVADGSMGAVCDVNGFWVPVGTGKCVMTCTPTTAVDGVFSNASPPPGTVTYMPGDHRMYTCITEYGSSTCNYAECQTDGSWLTYGTGCVAYCGVPTFSGELSNVVVLEYSGQLYDDVAVLGCSAPYVADGSMGAVCDVNGFWVPVGTGKCVMTCTPTPALDGVFSNAAPTPGTMTYTEGDRRTYACTAGHTSPTCNYALCQSDGSWLTFGTGCVAVTVCSGQPPGYSSTDGGLTATKTCPDGSVLTATCNAGTWLLPSGTCPPATVCSGQLPAEYLPTDSGLTATTICYDGSVLTAICNAGTWLLPSETCPPATVCSGQLPAEYSPTASGLTATKTCPDGSVLTAICHFGTWLLPSGTCPPGTITVTGCGSPPVVLGAVGEPVISPVEPIGLEAVYTCDPLSTMQTTATALCDGATWSVLEPGCESVYEDCKASLQTAMGPLFPNNIKRCAWFRGYCNCMWEADVSHPDGMTTICEDKFPGISSSMVKIIDADWNAFMTKFGQSDAITGIATYWHAAQVTADGSNIVDSYTQIPLLYKAVEPTAADAGKCLVFNADLALPATWEFYECTLPKDKQKTVCSISDPRIGGR